MHNLSGFIRHRFASYAPRALTKTFYDIYYDFLRHAFSAIKELQIPYEPDKKCVCAVLVRINANLPSVFEAIK